MVSVLEATDSRQLRRGHSAVGQTQSPHACKQPMPAARSPITCFLRVLAGRLRSTCSRSFRRFTDYRTMLANSLSDQVVDTGVHSAKC